MGKKVALSRKERHRARSVSKTQIIGVSEAKPAPTVSTTSRTKEESAFIAATEESLQMSLTPQAREITLQKFRTEQAKGITPTVQTVTKAPTTRQEFAEAQLSRQGFRTEVTPTQVIGTRPSTGEQVIFGGGSEAIIRGRIEPRTQFQPEFVDSGLGQREQISVTPVSTKRPTSIGAITGFVGAGTEKLDIGIKGSPAFREGLMPTLKGFQSVLEKGAIASRQRRLAIETEPVIYGAGPRFSDIKKAGLHITEEVSGILSGAFKQAQEKPTEFAVDVASGLTYQKLKSGALVIKTSPKLIKATELGLGVLFVGMTAKERAEATTSLEKSQILGKQTLRAGAFGLGMKTGGEISLRAGTEKVIAPVKEFYKVKVREPRFKKATEKLVRTTMEKGKPFPDLNKEIIVSTEGKPIPIQRTLFGEPISKVDIAKLRAPPPIGSRGEGIPLATKAGVAVKQKLVIELPENILSPYKTRLPQSKLAEDLIIAQDIKTNVLKALKPKDLSVEFKIESVGKAKDILTLEDIDLLMVGGGRPPFRFLTTISPGRTQLPKGFFSKKPSKQLELLKPQQKPFPFEILKQPPPAKEFKFKLGEITPKKAEAVLKGPKPIPTSEILKSAIVVRPEISFEPARAEKVSLDSVLGPFAESQTSMKQIFGRRQTQTTPLFTEETVFLRGMKPVTSEKQITSQGIITKSILNQMLNVKPITDVKVKQTQMIFQAVSQKQKQRQKQKQGLLLKSKPQLKQIQEAITGKIKLPRVETIRVRISDKKTPPYVPPPTIPFFDLGLKKAKPKPKKKKLKLKRRTRFQPSLIGVVENIFAKKPPKILTGLSIRPIIK